MQVLPVLPVIHQRDYSLRGKPASSCGSFLHHCHAHQINFIHYLRNEFLRQLNHQQTYDQEPFDTTIQRNSFSLQ